MARTPKLLQPLDRHVVRILLEDAQVRGITQRTLAARSHMSLNRVGIVLRGEAPPVTIGELSALAHAIGVSADSVLSRANDAVDAESASAGLDHSIVGAPNKARSRQEVRALTVEIARLIDAAMTSRSRRMTRSELARLTGIEQSQVSRMLTPTKPMFVEEFVAICRAVGVIPGEVIHEAERRITALPDPERRTGSHPVHPAPGDNRQVPSRPAHGPAPARDRGAGRTRSHGNG